MILAFLVSIYHLKEILIKYKHLVKFNTQPFRLSKIINQSYKNIKIINFFVSKIIIDEKEFVKLPDNIKNKSHIIFEFKFLCLPNDNFNKIKNFLMKII